MALSTQVAYTTTGTKASVNTDPSIAPFTCTVAVNVGTTGTYKMQYSLDDPSTVTDANAIWYDSTNMPASTTTSVVTSLVSPVSRVRLVIAAISGTITLQVSQGFTIN